MVQAKYTYPTYAHIHMTQWPQRLPYFRGDKNGVDACRLFSIVHLWHFLAQIYYIQDPLAFFVTFWATNIKFSPPRIFITIWAQIYHILCTNLLHFGLTYYILGRNMPSQREMLAYAYAWVCQPIVHRSYTTELHTSPDRIQSTTKLVGSALHFRRTHVSFFQHVQKLSRVIRGASVRVDSWACEATWQG